MKDWLVTTKRRSFSHGGKSFEGGGLIVRIVTAGLQIPLLVWEGAGDGRAIVAVRYIGAALSLTRVSTTVPVRRQERPSGFVNASR